VSVVGIDLAGVQTRPTGFCTLHGLSAVTTVLLDDKTIIEKTLAAQPRIIAIDAPLYLPPGRVSLEDRNGPHLRMSDRELLKMHIKFFPATLGPMRKLTARGIKLRSTFQETGLHVIEAYPGGAQDVLGIPRKQHGMDRLLAGLQALGILGLNSKMNDHELDAVTCAYVGKLFLEGKAVEVGTPGEGIVLPKKEK
jgi:predicted nuclease with RNAse H fold